MSTETMQQTSSGKKLYSILKQAWECDGNTAIIQVWVKVLEADPQDYTDIAEKIGYLFELINDVKNDINGLEIDSIDKFVKPLAKVQVFLMSNNLLDINSWKTIKDNVTEETLYLIDACGELIISQAKGVNEITSEDLTELHQQIRDLIDEISRSDIDKDAKRFFINELTRIESTILNYKIKGSSGLTKVGDETTGRIIKSWDLIDSAKEYGSKVINLLLIIDKVARGYETVHKLLAGFPEIVHLLPPGHNG